MLHRAGRRSSAGRRLAMSCVVERPVEAVVLRGDAVAGRAVGHARAGAGSGVRSSPAAFQWSTASLGVEHLGVADGLVERAEAERGQVLAHLLGDVLEEGDDELGLAGEPLAQLGVLGGDADRAGVEVADAHHDAAATPPAGRWRSRTPRRRAGRRSTTSRPVFSWPSTCTTMRSRRPLSSSVCWVSARPSSHGAPACLSEVSGDGAGAAVVAGDQHDVGVGLGHAGGHRADARPRRPA